MTNKFPRNRTGGRKVRHKAVEADGPVWLWGAHACAAALANPRRRILRQLATENAARRLNLGEAEIVTARQIDAELPRGAVHQGVAVRAEPLEPSALEDVIGAGARRIAVLDQVEDPHNLGAIFRTAAAFRISALVLQTRHAPPVTGIVAKAAAGAVETLPEVRVVNIARALDALGAAGYWRVGLAGEGEANIAEAVSDVDKLVIVLGAEGAGLRPAVARACDTLARIDIAPEMESLNVSNAAAIAFYAAGA